MTSGFALDSQVGRLPMANTCRGICTETVDNGASVASGLATLADPLGLAEAWQPGNLASPPGEGVGTLLVVAVTVKTDRPCDDCATPTNRRHKETGRPVCADCALERTTRNARALAAKSGPEYERWRSAMLRTFSA